MHMGDYRYEIVHRFLIKVLVCSADSTMVMSDTAVVQCDLVGINRLRIIFMDHVSPLVADMAREARTGILLVTKNYHHSKELLAYNNKTTMDLMRVDVLVAHISSMMCTLSMNPTYGVLYLRSSGDTNTDRRNIISMCADGNTVYMSMMGRTSYSVKPNSLFYHRLTEPLETLGAEYIFSLFKISNELSVDATELIYVFRSEDVINIVTP